MSQAPTTSAEHDAHDDHGHPPYLAHHFESMQQQTDAGKLAMWVFLATEILMFGGLFCAYSVWRARHYDIFETGHVYLNTWWGALNTLILIASSFTMAWGVRAAQLNKQKFCVIMLFLTFLGGLGFMGIKYIEYSAKFSHGMGPGRLYRVPADAEKVLLTESGDSHAADAASMGRLVETGHKSRLGVKDEHHGPKLYDESAPGHDGELAEYLNHYGHTPEQLAEARPFFSIYFALTGLHGLHVLIGMALVAWAMIRAYHGHFNTEYNAPVDIVGLYWHLVDLIWIFLFPLLYLI